MGDRYSPIRHRDLQASCPPGPRGRTRDRSPEKLDAAKDGSCGSDPWQALLAAEGAGAGDKSNSDSSSMPPLVSATTGEVVHFPKDKATSGSSKDPPVMACPVPKAEVTPAAKEPQVKACPAPLAEVTPGSSKVDVQVVPEATVGDKAWPSLPPAPKVQAPEPPQEDCHATLLRGERGEERGREARGGRGETREVFFPLSPLPPHAPAAKRF